VYREVRPLRNYFVVDTNGEATTTILTEDDDEEAAYFVITDPPVELGLGTDFVVRGPAT
jgi:hypothetical protein